MNPSLLQRSELPFGFSGNEEAETTVSKWRLTFLSILPLRFILTGLAALCVGIGLLVVRPDILAAYHYNQYAIAATHLFVLGWLCTVVMGAMYQLVPVALETRLYSERLARWHFVFHVIGFTGMVWMFWTWNMKQVGHFASVFALGVSLFVFNIARTLRRVPRWNVVATAVASVLVWLSMVVLAGLIIAAGKCTYNSASTLSPGSALGALVHTLRSAATLSARFDQLAAMHAHAHLGGIGVFLILTVGVSYKLIPMFTLSEIQSRRRAAGSLLLLNAGLLGAFAAVLLRSRFKLVCTLVVLLGLAFYAWELRAILRARKRRKLDWGIRHFLAGLGLLVPLSILAVTLSWPGLPLTVFTGQLENLYGFLALGGVFTLVILGMLYKIIPFLAWYASYSRLIGRYKVPALAELYSSRLQGTGLFLYLGGLLVTSIAILLGNALLVRAGCSFLAASLVLFGINVGKILCHMITPQLEPLPVHAAAGLTLEPSR